MNNAVSEIAHISNCLPLSFKSKSAKATTGICDNVEIQVIHNTSGSAAAIIQNVLVRWKCGWRMAKAKQDAN